MSVTHSFPTSAKVTPSQPHFLCNITPFQLHSKSMFFLFLFLKVFIYSLRLHQVLVVACGLSYGTHVGSSSPTTDRTWAPCIGSVESYPLDHQGSSPKSMFFLFYHHPTSPTPARDGHLSQGSLSFHCRLWHTVIAPRCGHRAKLLNRFLPQSFLNWRWRNIRFQAKSMASELPAVWVPCI